MTFGEALLVAMASSLASVLLGLLGLLVHRRLRRAKVNETEAAAEERRAAARKSDAETWGLMNSSLVKNVELLQAEVAELREANEEVRREHREALRHIVDVHEWDAAGRPGEMPRMPAALDRSGRELT